MLGSKNGNANSVIARNEAIAFCIINQANILDLPYYYTDDGDRLP
ncbi:hypothetical protein [Nostoc sp. PCC 7107]|nr:hypothetical protein [Nostoc sp. PCC 7107]